VASDLSILCDVLLEVRLRNGGFFLVDDVDEKTFLVLTGAVAFAVLAAPLDVAAVLLLELRPCLPQKDRDRLPLLLLP
jgi:hypothetical protein